MKPPSHPRLGVVGGGWAGLAAAVEASRLGWQVAVFEMAASWGGRAREIQSHGEALDNGQHILIGAYTTTLEMMRHVGIDPAQALWRQALQIRHPDGRGLQLGSGAPMAAFVTAVCRHSGWTAAAKWCFLTAAGRWALSGFRCRASMSVAELTHKLPASVRRDLLDPLCVAALNTPPASASASVFLRVLRDALFSGPGSSDLLLPRWRLSQLWPEPAAAWLERRGAQLRLRHRIERLDHAGPGWALDGQEFDAVVLACAAGESARLAAPHAPEWASLSRQLPQESIATVYADSAGVRLPQAMLALQDGDDAPAQFVFDLGQIAGQDGLLAFVVSAANRWLEDGSTVLAERTLRQGETALAAWLVAPLGLRRCVMEKKATFLCHPELARPCAQLLPGLVAAGDHIDGPYPATLEGAMRSGVAAARGLAGAGRLP